jgi:glycogen synthase
MAAGLRYCDRALTVSPSYAVECCTDPEKGGSVKVGRYRRRVKK